MQLSEKPDQVLILLGLSLFSIFSIFSFWRLYQFEKQLFPDHLGSLEAMCSTLEERFEELNVSLEKMAKLADKYDLLSQEGLRERPSEDQKIILNELVECLKDFFPSTRFIVGEVDKIEGPLTSNHFPGAIGVFSMFRFWLDNFFEAVSEMERFRASVLEADVDPETGTWILPIVGTDGENLRDDSKKLRNAAADLQDAIKGRQVIAKSLNFILSFLLPFSLSLLLFVAAVVSIAHNYISLASS